MNQPKHWQAIIGNFEFVPPDVIFKGAIDRKLDTQEQFLTTGVAICDLPFEGGKITTSVTFNDLPTVPSVQIVTSRRASDGSFISAGLKGWGLDLPAQGQFAIEAFDGRQGGSGLQTLAQTSHVERPRTGQLELTVKQLGSLIDLYADGVQVLRHVLPFAADRSQCGLWCSAGGAIRVTDYSVETRERTAFVVMQFSPPFENLFTEVIKPIASEFGIKAEKADDVVGPGIIMVDMIRQIEEADLVIADITPANQNVFYELGYAHALGKPTILLAEKGRTLPFDVSGFRVLFYENSIAGKSQIEHGLRRHIEAISKSRAL